MKAVSIGRLPKAIRAATALLERQPLTLVTGERRICAAD
jgi:hypothetical protein